MCLSHCAAPVIRWHALGSYAVAIGIGIEWIGMHIDNMLWNSHYRDVCSCSIPRRDEFRVIR